MTAIVVLAVILSAVAVALCSMVVAPPPPRLRQLIRVLPARGMPSADAAGDEHVWRTRVAVAESNLAKTLRQAGLARGARPGAAVHAHALRIARAAITYAVAAGSAAATIAARPTLLFAAVLLGGLAGGARAHGEVERALRQRREQLALELYTVNQLLALDVRAGGGVAQALERVAQRADGVLSSELRDVLSAATAGVSLSDALEHAALITVEPAAARTYRLLAKGARYGADLATGLRALNEDLRLQRAEALERAATRRRAAMLVPIIGLLAPVMLLFIAAPLPSIVFGMD